MIPFREIIPKRVTKPTNPDTLRPSGVSAAATTPPTRPRGNVHRPWLTLGLGTALTTFVSVERVRAGAHFPTDVIAGAIAGGSCCLFRRFERGRGLRAERSLRAGA